MIINFTSMIEPHMSRSSGPWSFSPRGTAIIYDDTHTCVSHIHLQFIECFTKCITFHPHHSPVRQIIVLISHKNLRLRRDKGSSSVTQWGRAEAEARFLNPGHKVRGCLPACRGGCWLPSPFRHRRLLARSPEGYNQTINIVWGRLHLVWNNYPVIHQRNKE